MPDYQTSIEQKQVKRQKDRWLVKTGKRKFRFTDAMYRLIEEGAAIGCSIAEIAVLCGCGRDTLMKQKAREVEAVGTHNSRLCDALDAGHERMRADIRRALMDKVRSGNVEALKFACKVLLGLEETQRAVLEVSGITKLTDKELADQVRLIAIDETNKAILHDDT